jgi:hypothetical protein
MPLHPRTKAATIVVYECVGPEEWKPLKPAEVPDWLKEPEVMGEMVKGWILEGVDGKFYRAKKLADSKVVMHQKRSVMHKRPTIQ